MEKNCSSRDGWILDESSLKQGRVLGQGSYGSVTLMEDPQLRAYTKKTSSMDPLKNPNRLFGVVQYPPLNLRLTKTPELISQIESALKKHYPCPHKQKSPILTPPETPINTERPKALNFPILAITIGGWTREMKNPEDLKAKFYFARKKLMWEILEPDTMKRKIEIQWHDVLSLKTTYTPKTEILEVELSRPPTFFIETRQVPGKHTQWKHIDHDFTPNQSASIFRIHRLHFDPGVLQTNLDKLKSGDSFWSKLLKVPFPTLQSPYFDTDSPSNSNTVQYGHDKMVSFNVTSGLLHHQSQGFGHVGVEEGDINMATQIGAYDGKQINTSVQAIIQNNTTNQLIGMQAIQPPSQPINEHYHPGGYFPMVEEFSQTRNTWDSSLGFQTRNTWESSLGSQTINTWESSLGSQTINTWESSLGSQAYPYPLLETQTNSTMFQMNEVSLNPQVGSYVGDLLPQDIDNGRQQIDNFQKKPNQPIGFNHSYNQQINSNQLADYNYGYDQFGNNNGSLPPEL